MIGEVLILLILFLPWRKSVSLTGVKTIRNFLHALFTIRSHKMDTWYELLCRMNFDGKKLLMEFDYGS